MTMRSCELFMDRYLVETMLGRGAEGEVWGARGSADGRLVAIKILRETRAVVPLFRESFERGIQLCSRVRSRFVSEYIEDGVTPEGERFLVLGRLSGESLEKKLRREVDVPFEEVGPMVHD